MASCATSLLCRRAAASVRRSSVASFAPLSTSGPSSSASSSSPSTWKPPIEPGVEPAYDEALKYISSQQSRLKQEIPALEQEVQRQQKGTEARQIAEARLHSHVVASQINDPEVRWRAANSVNAPLSNPVFAHLREKSWRQNRLPRLIERIRLMAVLPDAIFHITPTVDVQVAFGEGEGFHDHGGQGGDVLPGCFVGAEKTMGQPSITVTPFHAEERLYTLAMIDSDAPCESTQSVESFAHWLVHDIPLSSTRTTVDVASSNEVLAYVPPHPQKGTKYHRYSIVLFQQSKAINAELVPKDRSSFSLHDYEQAQHLKAAGIHFWRAEWKPEARETISAIYADILQQHEPEYGRPKAR